MIDVYIVNLTDACILFLFKTMNIASQKYFGLDQIYFALFWKCKLKFVKIRVWEKILAVGITKSTLSSYL